jgi:hypothetical protein
VFPKRTTPSPIGLRSTAINGIDSRAFRDRLRLELLVGQQNFISTLTSNTRGRFITGTFETILGPHYCLQGNFTANRGDLSYDQTMFSIGYRFDSKRKLE